MIVLLTDFGVRDPYVGQLHVRLAQGAPGVPVIDLFHGLPAFAVQSAAYLLAAYTQGLPTRTVVVAVVDPGVGSARAGIWLQAGGCHYVGPDNGLFEFVARRIGVTACAMLEVPANASPSFHGRDVFVPAAVQLVTGKTPASSLVTMTRFLEWPDDYAAIIYIDHYGNAITGLRAQSQCKEIRLASGQRLVRARTFSDCPLCTPFFYANANGLYEIAVNGGSAADLLGLALGDRIFPH